MAGPRTARGRARAAARLLAQEYTGELCELDHTTAFELLTATILSAQTTDARVNAVTPELFARYPTAHDLAVADPSDVERIVHSTGFYAAKTRSIIAMGAALVEGHGGDVPVGLDELVALPGVGRKTANLVRVVAFGQPGIPVDTHCGRVSRRVGLTTEEDPEAVERDLGSLLPKPLWGGFGLRLILHGRRVCTARSPRCDACVIEGSCPSSVVRRTPKKPSV